MVKIDEQSTKNRAQIEEKSIPKAILGRTPISSRYFCNFIDFWEPPGPSWADFYRQVEAQEATKIEEKSIPKSIEILILFPKDQFLKKH